MGFSIAKMALLYNFDVLKNHTGLSTDFFSKPHVESYRNQA
jgi:hypothetical protein